MSVAGASGLATDTGCLGASRFRVPAEYPALTVRNRISREGFEAPSAAVQLANNPYISPEEMIQTIVNEDSDLSLFAACRTIPHCSMS
jgi:hypothetical protein